MTRSRTLAVLEFAAEMTALAAGVVAGGWVTYRLARRVLL